MVPVASVPANGWLTVDLAAASGQHKPFHGCCGCPGYPTLTPQNRKTVGTKEDAGAPEITLSSDLDQPHTRWAALRDSGVRHFAAVPPAGAHWPGPSLARASLHPSCSGIQAAVAGVVVAAIVKGPAFGFSQYWVLVPLVTGYGMVLYSVAWLAAADKADSPQARVWRGSAFAVMGVIANVAFAYVFFSSYLAAVGWLTLAISSGHGLGLLTRKPRFYGSVLTDTASWMTYQHLTKLRARRAVAVGVTVAGQNEPAGSPSQAG